MLQSLPPQFLSFHRTSRFSPWAIRTERIFFYFNLLFWISSSVNSFFGLPLFLKKKFSFWDKVAVLIKQLKYSECSHSLLLRSWLYLLWRSSLWLPLFLASCSATCKRGSSSNHPYYPGSLLQQSLTIKFQDSSKERRTNSNTSRKRHATVEAPECATMCKQYLNFAVVFHLVIIQLFTFILNEVYIIHSSFL